jgi:hypothetical protein
MNTLIKLIREIRKCKPRKPDKVSELIGKLQVYRDTPPEPVDPDLFLFGIATGLEKISDCKTYEHHYDDRLNELSEKIERVLEREGLGSDGYFKPGAPDSPEDYQSLNIEFDHRLDEILRDVIYEFGEKELGDLFWNDRKEYVKRYYNGWRILEKDNPKLLEEINGYEILEIEELGLDGV